MTAAGWERTRLKYLVDCNRRVLSESTAGDYAFKYVDISAVGQGTISIPDESTRFMNAPSRARRLADPGDTIISTVRTYLRAVATVPETDEDLVFSTGFAVLHPHGDVSPQFLAYVLQGDVFVDKVVANSVGVSYPAITAADLMALDLLLPPLNEQRATADYLDQETAQIDALVAKQEEFIGLLRERRDATWARGFSEAAEGSRLTPLRRVVTSIVDGPFGSSLTSAHYADSGTRVIRLGNIGLNAFRSQDEAYISHSYAKQLGGHDARPGDVVIAGLGDEKWPLGRAAVVPELGPAIVKADCFRVRPASGVTGDYLAWALSAPQTRTQVALLARGSTRQRINTAIARTIEIPVPSASIQKSVLMLSDRELCRIDALIAKAEQHISLAKERRSALITAAVTGQIDVRTARKAA